MQFNLKWLLAATHKLRVKGYFALDARTPVHSAGPFRMNLFWFDGVNALFAHCPYAIQESPGRVSGSSWFSYTAVLGRAL